ncbi:MAG TPA: hypothetical protein VFH83_12610, partial [Spirochaetia bacterium]|nr:hypothetical protein [Spirochaetia bacterium]
MTLARDPMFCCVIMYPTDRELAMGLSDIHLGSFSEKSFQGFPLRAAKVVRQDRPAAQIAADLASCGFTAALLVGFCGSNFTPEDIRSARFVRLTKALAARGMTVGVCIPFADTVDNQLTRADPRMHQLRHDGKRPYIRFDPEITRPPYALYTIDYGSESFIRFAQEIVLAARDAGMSFIDFAEPDYWPTEGNGYGSYLEEAWRKRYKEPLPYPSDPRHRLFMEDYHLESLRRITAFAHEHGIRTHLTASPLGHAPYHICQNYGKYSTTEITELSSTYHHTYGLAWRDRIQRRYGVRFGDHRLSTIGCLEARGMRGWDERHATYLVPGQSLPAETCANALDQQMFLHNMDVVFWEYPSIRTNYYETDDPWFTGEKAWHALRDLFRQRSEQYRALPATFHRAHHFPEALVYFSKRGVYAEEAEDRTTPCAYATALKLQSENVLPAFLFAERLAPLESTRHEARLLLMDEHHPVSMQGWTRIRRWLGRGRRVVVYGGEPGWRWEMDGPRKGFAPEMERLFGVQKGGTLIPGGRVVPAPPLDPLPQGMQRVEVSARRGVRTLQSADGRPFVYLKRLS